MTLAEIYKDHQKGFETCRAKVAKRIAKNISKEKKEMTIIFFVVS